MAWYDCIVSNQWDGKSYYKKGRKYEIDGTPPAAYFTAISAAEVDVTRGGFTAPLYVERDLDREAHIYDDINFDGTIRYDKDLVIKDVSMYDAVARALGTGAIDITSPGVEKATDTTFNYYGGKGYFYDHTDPDNPVLTLVEWDGDTGITDSYVATNLRTWLAIDSNGDIQQFADEVTPLERRTNIIIGVLTHIDGATITNVNWFTNTIYGIGDKVHDICQALKFVNDNGNVYSGYSTSTLQLKKTAGRIFACDRNYAEDKDSPNFNDQPAADPVAAFFAAYQDGSGGQTISIETTVDTSYYDDGTGTLAAIPAGYWCTHRLYTSVNSSGNTLLVYGQDTHRGRGEALAELSSEVHNELPGASELLLRGFLTFRVGETSLKDNSNVIFTPADKYGIHPLRRATSIDLAIPSFKPGFFTSNGVGAGTYYAHGYYQAPAADANLTQASTTVSYGTAGVSYAAHPFIVAGGAGTVDTGVVGLRANFTKIDDGGTRTTSFTEVISADITTLSTDEYVEVVGKVLGAVQFELYVVSGSPTTYSLDFNYGLAKYEDFGNRDCMITDFEVTGLASATDTGFQLGLLKHDSTGWTYSAAGFVPGNGFVVSMNTDHSTDDNTANGQNLAYKRADINEPMLGAIDEGVVTKIVTTQNNTVQALTAHVGVVF